MREKFLTLTAPTIKILSRKVFSRRVREKTVPPRQSLWARKPILILLCLMLGACTVKSPLSVQHPSTLRQKKISFFENQKKLKSLQGYAQLSIAHPRGLDHLEGAFWIESPEKLRFLWLDEFGQSLMDLRIADNWVWIQDFQKNQEQLYEVEGGSLKKALKVQLTLQELLDALMLHQAPSDPKKLSYGKLMAVAGFFVPQETLFNFKRAQLRVRIKEAVANPLIKATNFWIPKGKTD